MQGRVEPPPVPPRDLPPVADLGEGTRLGGYGRHTVSPDGRSIVFTREDGRGSDIMMVDSRSLFPNR